MTDLLPAHPILDDRRAWTDAIRSFSQATGLACTLFDRAGNPLASAVPSGPVDGAQGSAAPDEVAGVESGRSSPIPEEVAEALVTRKVAAAGDSVVRRWAVPVEYESQAIGAILVWGPATGVPGPASMDPGVPPAVPTLELMVQGLVQRQASQLELLDSPAAVDSAEEHLRHEKLRALGEMATGIAHNFNNTLCAVVSHAELIRHRPDASEPIRVMAQTIVEAAMEGSMTAGKMLEFARSTANRHFQPVLLTQLVDDVLHRYGAQWQPVDPVARDRLKVVTRLDRTPAIAGRQPELRRLLMNLLINSVEAMPRGGELVIATGREDSGRCFLSVSDTGVGMPDEVRRNMFDPFFTTKGPGSNGLGLSVVYGILRRHQGEIEVSSQPGVGTRIKLVFRPWRGGQ